MPHVTHVGALSNPANPVSTPIVSAMTAAATPLKLEVEVFKVHGPSDFVGAFGAVAKSRVNAVAVTEDGEFAASFKTIAALAAGKNCLRSDQRSTRKLAGPIGDGVNILSLYRRAAYFIDKILKGSKPADLPIEQPTRFDFVINLKTAKALDLEASPALLSRADEVIE